MVGKIYSVRIEDLVVLQYASNTCCTNVVDAASFEDRFGIKLSIDLSKNTWSYHTWDNVMIGKSRSPYSRGTKSKEGVIGVYNRLSTKHLDSLAHDAKEFTAPENYGHDDY